MKDGVRTEVELPDAERATPEQINAALREAGVSNEVRCLTAAEAEEARIKAEERAEEVRAGIAAWVLAREDLRKLLAWPGDDPDVTLVPITRKQAEVLRDLLDPEYLLDE